MNLLYIASLVALALLGPARYQWKIGSFDVGADGTSEVTFDRSVVVPIAESANPQRRAVREKGFLEVLATEALRM